MQGLNWHAKLFCTRTFAASLSKWCIRSYLVYKLNYHCIYIYMCVSVFIYGYTLTHPWSVPFFVSVLTPPQKKKKNIKWCFKTMLRVFTRLPTRLSPALILSPLSSMGLRSCDVRSRSTLLACRDSWSTGCVEAISCLAAWALVGFFAADSGDVSETFPPRFREGRWFFGEQEESPKIWGTPRVFGVQVEMLRCLASRRHQKRRGCYRRTCSPSLPKRCFDKFDKVQLTMQVLSSIYIIIELSSSFVPGKSPPKKKV